MARRAVGARSIRATIVGFASSALVGATVLVGAATVPADAHSGTVPAACSKGRVVCVSKSARSITWVVNGKPQFSLAARFGSSRTPSREGTFYIFWKNIDHVSSLYGSAMPFSMFYSGGQAIHFSSDFVRNGYAGASHGCVNTRDYAATRRLFNSTRVGDKVYVYG